MKRFLCLITVIAALATSVQAEGYQVNTLSAKQLGMGHVGVSMKLNSESLWFNPAGAAFQDSKFHISAGVTGIAATAKWSSINQYDGSPIQRAKSDNSLSTPIYLYANWKMTDDLAFGLSMNTPFGSSMNWGDNWAGAHVIQDIMLESYNIQPTLSYKFLDDKLSVGVGLMISWGNIELSRSMFPVGENCSTAVNGAIIKGLMDKGLDYATASATASGMMDNFNPLIDAVGDNPLASATLSGESNVEFGVNVGLMYNINEKWTLGLSYRSKMDMGVDAGSAELSYANDLVQGAMAGLLPAIDQGTFSSSLPFPETFSAGVTFRPTEQWKISAEIQHVGWSAYDNLNIQFDDPSLDGYSINTPKNYSNTLITRFGAQYEANSWLTARCGFYVDESPVDSDYLNPETPSMTKVSYTCGASLYPCDDNRDFSIDIAYAYISAADPERAGQYPTDYGAFAGNYSTKAHAVSIGASFAF